MMKEYLRMALQNLAHRKLRSWLTMIGIFIGITAVVAIISLGQGLQIVIHEQFTKLGTDKLFISPGTNVLAAGATAVTLTEKDRKVIARVRGVSDTLGMSYKNARITYKDEEHYALVAGVTKDGADLFRDIWGANLMKGRLLQEGEKSKAYLGYDYTRDNKVFTHSVKLFDTISVNNHSFKVVGFQEKLGNSGDDQTIYITEGAYTEVFGERLKDDYKTIIARIAEGEDPSVVASRVKKELRRARGLDEGDEDFTVQSAEELIESFQSIILIVNVVIIGIAAISLLVGGIGIMNTMYTAVVERTKEIGILKAIGAQNKDILLLFLIESGLLGLVGGAIGVLCGLGLSKLVEIGGAAAIGTPYLRMWWSWGLIAGALLFSFIVGAGSGLAPAWQASKQKPVDSLRYE